MFKICLVPLLFQLEDLFFRNSIFAFSVAFCYEESIAKVFLLQGNFYLFQAPFVFMQNNLHLLFFNVWLQLEIVQITNLKAGYQLAIALLFIHKNKYITDCLRNHKQTVNQNGMLHHHVNQPIKEKNEYKLKLWETIFSFVVINIFLFHYIYYF